MDEQMIELNPKDLTDSPFQPRTEYDIDELSNSMSLLGVLQSLLVRPVGAEYELVAGHRRKRAAIKAGIELVPCIVREMDDDEARMSILIENSQRQDLPPLEELETFSELAEHMEVAAIAAKIGRSEDYVYRRLRLRDLCDAARNALREGAINLAVAESIASVDGETQELAVEALAETEYRGPASAAQASRWLETQGSMRLKVAPFDIEALGLVGAPDFHAGPCTDCPHNTAVSSNLFPDMDEDPRCTNRPCYEAKKEAAWEMTKEQAVAEGKTVVEDREERSKIVNVYGGLKAHWLNLDETFWGDTAKTSRTIRRILGKKRMPLVQVHVLRDPYKGTIEVVKKAAVKKALKEEPKDNDPPRLIGGKSEFELKVERDQKVKKQLDRLILNRVDEACETDFDVGKTWTLLALGVLGKGWADTISIAAKRRGLVVAKPTEEVPFPPTLTELLEQWILGNLEAERPTEPPVTVDGRETRKKHKATGIDLKAFVYEMLAIPTLSFIEGAYIDLLLNTADIDVDELKKKAGDMVDRQLEAKAKRKAERKAKKSKKKKAEPKVDPKTKIDDNTKAFDPDDPETVKTMLALHEDGKSYADIAKELGFSKDQVARRVRAARTTE